MKYKPLTEFGHELSTAMAVLDFKQAKLARRLGVSRSAVNQYFREENIGLGTMQKIAAEMNCEVSLRIIPKKDQPK